MTPHGLLSHPNPLTTWSDAGGNHGSHSERGRTLQLLSPLQCVRSRPLHPKLSGCPPFCRSATKTARELCPLNSSLSLLPFSTPLLFCPIKNIVCRPFDTLAVFANVLFPNFKFMSLIDVLRSPLRSCLS